MVKPKPDIRYPVVCNFSSFFENTHLSTVNVSDLNTYSKVNIELANYMDGAAIEDLWLGHQSFVNSICEITDLEKMTGSVWVDRIENVARQILDIRVKKREVFLDREDATIYRQHPWLSCSTSKLLVGKRQKAEGRRQKVKPIMQFKCRTAYLLN